MDGFTELTDARNIRPALVATGAWVGVGLALDAYLLVKREEYLISDVLRTRPGKAFLLVLGLHVINVLGRADPFRAAASMITNRLADVAVEVLPEALTDALPGK